MRQLSFAFLRSGQHATEHCANSANSAKSFLRPRTIAMRRINPAKNMARFYSLEVERDLFGRVVLVRRWGRIGTAGKTRLDEHAGEGEALVALQTLQAAKRQKGYRPICNRSQSPDPFQ